MTIATITCFLLVFVLWLLWLVEQINVCICAFASSHAVVKGIHLRSFFHTFCPPTEYLCMYVCMYVVLRMGDELYRLQLTVDPSLESSFFLWGFFLSMMTSKAILCILISKQSDSLYEDRDKNVFS